MTKSAAIYARISDDRTGEQAGVDRQREDCLALAEQRGWPVAETYIDNDLSAYNGAPRPAYRRLIADIEAGAIDAVVTWHLDRLHRHPRELEEFFETCDRAGLRDMATVSGNIDLSTDDGRFHARILGAVARKESDDKSRRIRRKAEDLAREGKVGGGGTRPFGFEEDRRTHRRVEARLIRHAAEKTLLGASLRGICAEWNEKGIKTPAGKTWATHSLRRLLLSPRIAGLRQHRGEVVGDAEWKPIIDRKTHEALTRLLTDPRRTVNGGAQARKYLLTGMAYCGLCGSRLVARPRGKGPGEETGRRAYVCASGPNFGGCGKIGALAEPFEGFVTDAVFAALDSEAFTKTIQGAGDDGREADLLTALREDQDALEQLHRDLYVDRVIDRAGFLAAKGALDDRVEATKRRLGQVGRAAVLASTTSGAEQARKEWDRRDLHWRRALVGAVLERVVVNPAVKGRIAFDPSRFELRWRV
jgi:site-specific DNA recombinase